MWGVGQGVQGPLPLPQLPVQPQGLVSPYPAAVGATVPPRKGVIEAPPHSDRAALSPGKQSRPDGGARMDTCPRPEPRSRAAFSWLMGAENPTKTLKNLLVLRRRCISGQGVTAPSSPRAAGTPPGRSRLVPHADRRWWALVSGWEKEPACPSLEAGV